jgi:hypothetical protein
MFGGFLALQGRGSMQDLLRTNFLESRKGEVRRKPLLERLSGNSYTRVNLLTISLVMAA